MSDRGEDDHDLRAIRKTREVEQGLRQFLKIETGLGKSAAYRRGHIWNFEWCSTDPALAQPDKVVMVQRMMEWGKSFDEAFDWIHSGHCDGSNCGEPCSVCGAEYGGACDGMWDGEKCKDSVRRCVCADGP